MNKNIVTFKDYVKLYEGSNAIVGDIHAQEIHLDDILLEKLKKTISTVLFAFNSEFEKENGVPIFNNLGELIKNGDIFSGSAKHMFKTPEGVPAQDFEQLFREVKVDVGDVDLQVNDELKELISKFVNDHKGEHFGRGILIGSTFEKVGTSLTQTVTIWEIPIRKDRTIYVQMDLEYSEYEDEKPSPFAQWSKSSPWVDMAAGIKGFFHKAIISSIFKIKALSNEAFAVISPAGLKAITNNEKTIKRIKEDRNPKISNLKFSVDHGARLAYTAAIIDGKSVYVRRLSDKESSYILVDDQSRQNTIGYIKAFVEIDTAVSKMRSFEQGGYTKNIAEIFELAFDRPPINDDMKKFDSFIGICNLVKENFDRNQVDEVLGNFVDMIWTSRSPKFVRGNPDKDRQLKDIAFFKFMEIVYGDTGRNINKYREIKIMRDNFYLNY